MARKVRSGAAKRSRKPKVKEPQEAPAPSTQEVFDRHMRRLRPLLAAQESAKQAASAANKLVSEAFKGAKADGVDIKELKFSLAVAALEPHEIDAKFKTINRYMVWLKASPGSQLGLFDEGSVPKSIMTAAEDVQREKRGEGPVGDLHPLGSPQSIANARALGERLGHNSGGTPDCPYPEGSVEHGDFWEGWNDVQAQRAMQLADEAAP